MKRFTDSEKWRDPWFRKLTLEFKAAYLFLLDNVDNAGVWQPDYELADFQIGAVVDWAGFVVALGDRLQIIEGSGKWHLTRFVAFQYGELKEDCKPHQQVFRLLESHQIQRVSKGYPKGIHTLKDKDKDKDKEKDMDKDGAILAEMIYQEFPRKVAKQDAIKAIEKAMESEPAAKLLEKTKAYADATAIWPDEDRKFIPHPATWFNRGSYDDDPQTWVRIPKTTAVPWQRQTHEIDHSKGF